MHSAFAYAAEGDRSSAAQQVAELCPEPDGITAEMENKPSVKADMVIVALGVVPETHLAAQAGLELGPKGSVMVDEHMRTSDPDIYAAGDAVCVKIL